MPPVDLSDYSDSFVLLIRVSTHEIKQLHAAFYRLDHAGSLLGFALVIVLIPLPGIILALCLSIDHFNFQLFTGA